MKIPYRVVARRLVSGIAVLTAALGLPAAAASAANSTARTAAAETQLCGEGRTYTVGEVTVTVRACVAQTLNTPPEGSIVRMVGTLSIEATPAQPVTTCRAYGYVKTPTNTWAGSTKAFDCMDAVNAGTATVSSLTGLIGPQDPAQPTPKQVTALVTLEFATTNGPLQVVASRFTATTPF